MRITVCLTCVIAAVACGCARQEAPQSEAATASLNENSKSNATTAGAGAPIVTLRSEEKGRISRSAPVVPRGAKFRVQGTASVSGLPKERQHVIVQIFHSDGGVEVMDNSAVPDEKRDGDVVKFEAVIKSPSKPGSYRVIAVNGDAVFCSSALTVE